MARRWTEVEERYLLLNFSEYDAQFLSNVLDRTASAIESKYYRLLDSEIENHPRELEFVLRRAGRANPKKLKEKANIETEAKKSGWSGKRNPYAHTKSGYRPDLDLVLRSGWEANILRVLESYDVNYEYEPKTFEYPVKRGNKTYTPDALIDGEEWLEVKGYFDDNSRIKINRFRIHYPDEFEKMWIIIGRGKKSRKKCEKIGIPDDRILFYHEFRKLFKDQIPTWEGR